MIVVKGISKHFKVNRKQRREMGVSKDQKYVDAVSNVSFTCKPGRVFTLLGPNGAGKTTALRMISTMLRPSTGSIEVNGFDTVKESEKVRRSIGFLTGSTQLYKRLTPSEVIKYYADLHGIEKKLFETRKEELFDLLGIHEFASKRIGKLSSGMKQKVSIARTMIHDPSVVVFDEPTVGLDVLTSRNIIKLIKDCRKNGKTVIFSTHIMGEVSLLSDDMAIIHQGKLLFNDSYDNFVKQMKSRTIEDEFVRYVGGEE